MPLTGGGGVSADDETMILAVGSASRSVAADRSKRTLKVFRPSIIFGATGMKPPTVDWMVM